MSLSVLITGRLTSDPEARTAANGKAYTRARVAVPLEDGDCLASVIAFGSVAEQLAALAKGDTVSIAGRAKPSAWRAKESDQLRAGLDVTADQLLTTYHLRQRRKAMRGAEGATDEA